MLIIGHRGASGLAPENTLEALRAGLAAGADMLEFDVRVTRDKVAVLSHDARLYGMRINQSTLKQLQQHGKVTLLTDILDVFFGKVLLNLEFKPTKDISIVYTMLADNYINNKSDWDTIIITSFRVRPLLELRRFSNDINLGLLHTINPFAFITYNRRLGLSAVGWHRLHVNKLAIEIAQRSGLFSYVYTINQPSAALVLEKRGIKGVVTDYPDRLVEGN